jgi:hypothetical protein
MERLFRYPYWEKYNAEEEDFQYYGTYLDRRTGWLACAFVHPGTQRRDTEVIAQEAGIFIQLFSSDCSR